MLLMEGLIDKNCQLPTPNSQEIPKLQLLILDKGYKTLGYKFDEQK